MPKINASTRIRKSPDIVYEILKDMEKFPEFMKDTSEVKLIKRINNKTVIAKWKADIDGTPVEWTEEVKFDPRRRGLKFRMLEGDFEEYEGTWTLRPATNGTILTLSTHLEWGLPNFEKYVGHILESKAVKSIRSMLWLIRKRAHKING